MTEELSSNSTGRTIRSLYAAAAPSDKQKGYDPGAMIVVNQNRLDSSRGVYHR